MSAKKFGELSLGEIPRVVGALKTFSSACQVTSADNYDIVEIRPEPSDDEIAWKNSLSIFTELQVPILLTLRSAVEGGSWNNDEVRAQLYKDTLDIVAGIDVEINSSILEGMVEAAHERDRLLIGSFHSFDSTPPLDYLENLLLKAERSKVDVLKIATQIVSTSDVWTLCDFLRTSQQRMLICVIGMGPLGVASRMFLPTLGSCLTYGYLDQPTAPGQTSCQELTESLRRTIPSFDHDVITRKQMRQHV